VNGAHSYPADAAIEIEFASLHHDRVSTIAPDAIASAGASTSDPVRTTARGKARFGGGIP